MVLGLNRMQADEVVEREEPWSGTSWRDEIAVDKRPDGCGHGVPGGDLVMRRMRSS